MNCGNITIEDINCVGEMISETQIATDNGEEEDSPHTTQQQLTSTTCLATEHGIFLRAILDLLTQRDQIALESDINNQNTIKVGTICKASHRLTGKWKTKYVELRRGTFSYYTDTPTSKKKQHDDLKRKDIQLHASKCTCQAVTIHTVKILSSSKTNGTVFEIKVQNGKRRLWMTNTIEECKSWIQAIHNAMIGASVVRGDNFLEYSTREQSKKKKNNGSIHVPTNSPYKAYLEQYLQIRQATQIATTKDECISALQTLEDQPMKVPVQWIRLQLSDNNNNTLSNTAFHELDVSTSVEQLWKDLLRDSVKFNNDEVLVGDAFHGPERIVGRLTQLILSSSCDTTLQDNSNNNNMEQSSSHVQSVISEAQAIRYARDILLASNRTRSGGDSYYCAENLCLNRNMIVICPSSSEATPLSITVTNQTKGSTIERGDSHVLEDVSGWVYTRSSSSKSWKRQYIMLSSHGVLTCYAEALPKPHELIEQITLHGAKIVFFNNNNSNLVEKQKVKHKNSSSKNESTFISGHVVHIKTKDGRTSREYLFEDEFDYLYWHDSLQQAANSLNKEEEANGISTSSVKSNGYHCNRLHSTPAVEVVVNVCTEYKIASMDPVGIESEDTWAKLRTTFVQNFSLTGGGDGRISRGDEVVQLELL